MPLEEGLSWVLKSRQSELQHPTESGGKRNSHVLSFLFKFLLSQLLWPLTPGKPKLSSERYLIATFFLWGKGGCTWKERKGWRDQSIIQQEKEQTINTRNSLGASQGHSLGWVEWANLKRLPTVIPFIWVSKWQNCSMESRAGVARG